MATIQVSHFSISVCTFYDACAKGSALQCIHYSIIQVVRHIYGLLSLTCMKLHCAIFMFIYYLNMYAFSYEFQVPCHSSKANSNEDFKMFQKELPIFEVIGAHVPIDFLTPYSDDKVQLVCKYLKAYDENRINKLCKGSEYIH